MTPQRRTLKNVTAEWFRRMPTGGTIYRKETP